MVKRKKTGSLYSKYSKQRRRKVKCRKEREQKRKAEAEAASSVSEDGVKVELEGEMGGAQLIPWDDVKVEETGTDMDMDAAAAGVDDCEGKVDEEVDAEEEVPAPPLQVGDITQLRPRPWLPSPVRCFVCVQTLAGKSKMKPADYTVLLEEMLGLSSNSSQHYLKVLKTPEAWIDLCSHCLSLTREGARTRIRIQTLERALKRCRLKITNKIKKTSTKVRAKHSGEEGEKREQRLAVETVLRYVQKRDYEKGTRKKSGPSWKKLKASVKGTSAPAPGRKRGSYKKKEGSTSISASVPPLPPPPAIIDILVPPLVEPEEEDSQRLASGNKDPLCSDEDDNLTLFERIKIRKRKATLKPQELNNQVFSQLLPLSPPQNCENLTEDFWTPNSPQSPHYNDDDYEPDEEQKCEIAASTPKVSLPVPGASFQSEEQEQQPPQLLCGLCVDEKTFSTQAELQSYTEEVHHRKSPEKENEGPRKTGRKQKVIEESKEGTVIKRKRGRPKGTPTKKVKEVPMKPEVGGNKNRRRGRPALHKETGESFSTLMDKGKQRLFDCPVCPNEKGYGINRFTQHLAIHRRRPYKCSACTALLPADEDLKERHWNEKHSKIEPQPEEKYSLLKLDPLAIWKCQGCSVAFPEKDQRDQHELTCSEVLSTSTAEADATTYLDCKTCQKSSRNFEEWRLHRALLHPEVDAISCLYCDACFGEPSEPRKDEEMLEHIKVDHENGRGMFMLEGVFFTGQIFDECDLCGDVLERGKGSTDMREKGQRPCPNCVVYAVKTEPEKDGVVKEQPHCPNPKNKKRNDDIYDYDCPDCPNVTNYKIKQFAQHLAIHWRRPYKCTACSSFLPAEPEMQERHWVEKHSDIPNPLPPEKFQKWSGHPGNIWKCAGCLTGLSSVENRDQHELNCSRMRLITPSTTETQQTCEVCKKISRNLEEWRLHRVLHHSEVDALSCLYCDTSFAETTAEGIEARNEDRLLHHINRAHHGNQNPFQYNRLYYAGEIFDECEPCGEVIEEAQRRVHLRRKHGTAEQELASPYPCPLCPKMFKSRLRQYQHTNQVHFLKHESVCELCGSKLATVTQLLDHKLREHHITPEDYLIHSCPEEGFSYKSVMRKNITGHTISVHAPPNKFICSYCGKGFNSTSKLHSHVMSHANRETRPYQCEQCGSGFMHPTSLAMHRRMVHEKRPFPSRLKRQQEGKERKMKKLKKKEEIRRRIDERKEERRIAKEKKIEEKQRARVGAEQVILGNGNSGSREGSVAANAEPQMQL